MRPLLKVEITQNHNKPAHFIKLNATRKSYFTSSFFKPFSCCRNSSHETKNHFLPRVSPSELSMWLSECAFGDVLDCAFLSLWSLFRSTKLRQHIYIIWKQWQRCQFRCSRPLFGLLFSGLCQNAAGCSCSNNAFHFPSMWTWSRAHSKDSTRTAFGATAPFHFGLIIPLHKIPSRRETISVRARARFPLWKFPMLSGFISPQTWRDKFTHALKSLIWHFAGGAGGRKKAPTFAGSWAHRALAMLGPLGPFPLSSPYPVMHCAGQMENCPSGRRSRGKRPHWLTTRIILLCVCDLAGDIEIERAITIIL